MNIEPEAPFPRPLFGDAVKELPSGLVPARTVLQGFGIRLEPINPAIHADQLYDISHITDEGRAIWTYLPEGPWPDRTAYGKAPACERGRCITHLLCHMYTN